MSRRAKIAAADIKPTTLISGKINATKCIAYLRAIGAEIDNAVAESWLDGEAVSRFLGSERRATREGSVWTCECGAMEGFSEVKRGVRRKKAREEARKMPTCEECGSPWRFMRLMYVVRRDGTIKDYRSMDERWLPIETYIANRTGAA